MSRVGLAALLLSGCNWVFGLHDTRRVDGRTADATIPLLVPPDGSTSCGSPPSFDAWTYTPHAIAGFSGTVIRPAFLSVDRVVFAYQEHLFESGTDSGAMQITSLQTPDFGVYGPAAAPDRSVFWYLHADGLTGSVYVATRAGGDWLGARTDLIEAYQIEPGSVGFYAGTARMIVSIRPTKPDALRLVELSSEDGLSWTTLTTAPPLGAEREMFDPALSPDGCYVLFSATDGTATPDLFVSVRGPDGSFGPPARLAVSSTVDDDVQPTIDPTQSKLWFLQGGQLIEGRPP